MGKVKEHWCKEALRIRILDNPRVDYVLYLTPSNSSPTGRKLKSRFEFGNGKGTDIDKHMENV